MSTLRVTTLATQAGVEVYTAKAWVNFNGTGTVAIRASGNVSSITDNGTGDYTVNFTVAMVDANYAAAAFVGSTVPISRSVDTNGIAPTASAIRITTRNSATGVTADDSIVCLSIFR